MNKSDAETKRIRYLLGQDSQAERERIEAEYFEDEAAFKAMLATEDDLVDAYARGELSDDERRRFETHFLSSSHGKERVQFARDLAGAVSAARPLEITTFQWRRSALRSATIAAMIVLIVIAWLFVERRKPSNEPRVEQVQVNKQSEPEPLSAGKRTHLFPETTRPEKSKAPSGRASRKQNRLTDTQRVRQLPTAADNSHEVASNKPTRTAEALIEIKQLGIAELPRDKRKVLGLLSLTPLIRSRFSLPPRSAHKGLTTISVPDNADFIAFRLELETIGQYEEYQVVIERVGHGRVRFPKTASFHGSDRESVETGEILQSFIPLGDYNLFLTGRDANGSFVRVAEYSFRVIKN